MRRRLLDATIACLVDVGYARTTTIEVAERANVSRGAMLHHYGSRAELVAAAIEHLASRRIAEFVSAVQALPDDADLEERIVDLLWSQFSSSTFDAALELEIAARTDAELRAHIHPRARQLETTIAAFGRALFAKMSTSEEQFETERRFIYFLLHGLALRSRAGTDPAEIEATLADLKRTMRAVRGARRDRTNERRTK